MKKPSYSELPTAVKAAQLGILSCFLALTVGGVAFNVLDTIRPEQRENGIPLSLWILLAPTWLPGMAGLMVAAYVIIRYPYLSLITDWMQETSDVEENDGASRAHWLRKPAGWSLTLLALLTVLSIVLISLEQGGLSRSQQLVFGYALVILGFGCYLVTRYERATHPTLATFLDITFGLGILLAPFFLPVLWLGRIHCRSKLDRLAVRMLFDGEPTKAPVNRYNP